MTVFSFRARDHKASHGSSGTGPVTLTKLYVIGSKPNEQGEAQWTLEVEEKTVNAGSSQNGSQGLERKHGFFSGSKSNQKGDAHHVSDQSLSEVEEQESQARTVFFDFTKNDFDQSSRTSPTNSVIRISVPLSTHHSSSSQCDQIHQCLRSIPSTPSCNSEERLKLSLQSLQQHSSHPIVPTVSQGFDIDKFMYFATSTLQYRYARFQSQSHSSHDADNSSRRPVPEQYVSQEQITACRAAEGTAQEIDYAKFLQENADLRRKMGEDSQPRTSDDNAAVSRRKKLFGGFWVSYAGEEVYEDGVRRPRDPYGGLM